MRCRTRDRRAFTLLEMLLAMALMSMLAGSLYASLRVGFRARRAISRAIEPVRKLEFAIELLRQDIESALPPVGILAGEFLGLDDEDGSGRDADALLLHSTAHTPGPTETRSGVRRVEIALATLEDEPGLALVRRITTNLLAPETVEPPNEVLCRDVLAFNLRYFDGSDWLDTWDSAAQDNVLPLAVEITLEVARAASGGDAAESYSASHVLSLPCGGMAQSEGTRIIGPSGR